MKFFSTVLTSALLASSAYASLAALDPTESENTTQSFMPEISHALNTAQDNIYWIPQAPVKANTAVHKKWLLKAAQNPGKYKVDEYGNIWFGR